jgi:chromate transporter
METRPTAVLAPRPLPPAAREPWPTFLRSMLHVGLNTFGGPVAQIGVMHQEAVEKRRWLTDGEFVHLLNFANVLPGPEALEIAIHLGYLRRGVWGGIVAGLLFIGPGFVTLTALGWLYVHFGHLAAIGATLDGIRPMAVALIAFAALRISLRALKGLHAYALLLAAFSASFFFAVPFIPLLLGAGALGLVLSRAKVPSLGRLELPLALTALGLALAAGLFFRPAGRTQLSASAPASVAATPVFPAQGFGGMAELAWINTKTALVTFGGAYTALPYLREQYVAERGWVSDAAVTDALALGETTPGPLICFGVFLAFLAGGFGGAVVGSFFLFLPSFVLVLGLGRHIEKVERLPGAAGFLWGVSAGTLGLILSLSAEIIPKSLGDPLSAALALIAFLALWRLQANVLLVVAAGAGVGLVRLWAGT